MKQEPGLEKTVIGRYEPVEVTGTKGSKQIPAKADTGSDRSTIDKEVLEEIGSTDPVYDVNTRSGGDVENRDVVPIHVDILNVEDGVRVVEADVTNRDSHSGDFLIGADLLQELDLLVNASIDNRED